VEQLKPEVGVQIPLPILRNGFCLVYDDCLEAIVLDR
jgi:hypothetical protein